MYVGRYVKRDRHTHTHTETDRQTETETETEHSGTNWSRFCKWNSPAGGTFQTQKRAYGRLHG